MALLALGAGCGTARAGTGAPDPTTRGSEVASSPSIHVRILDAQGSPAAFAEVEIRTPAGPRRVTADADGALALPAEDTDPTASGNRPWIVSIPGERSWSVAVTPAMLASGVLRLTEPDDEIDALVVRARSARVSRSYVPVVLDRLDVLTDPASAADPIIAVSNLTFSTNPTENAELHLRGARPTLSRTYLADIPVFEVTSGTPMAPETAGGSVFDLAAVAEVEAYPTNPPLFLSGTTGGAVRLLPPVTPPGPGSLGLNTAGLSVNRGFAAPGSDADYLELFAVESNFEPEAQLNPDIRQEVRLGHSRSAGLVWHRDSPDGASVTSYASLQTDRAALPLALLADDGIFLQDETRGYLLTEVSKPVGGLLLTGRAGLTDSRSRDRYLSLRALNRNAYGYLAGEASGTQPALGLTYRFGVSQETLDRRSQGTAPARGIDLASPPLALDVDDRVCDMAAYGFVSKALSDGLAAHLAMRRHLSGVLGPADAAQAGLAYHTADNVHRWVLSAGRYFGEDISSRAYFGPTQRSFSRQAQLDYQFRAGDLRLDVSLYSTREWTRARPFPGGVIDDASPPALDSEGAGGRAERTATDGAEASLTRDWHSGLTLRASLATIRQQSVVDQRRFPGAEDFPLIVRMSARIRLNESTSATAALNDRSGAPYTPVLGSTAVPSSPSVTPLFGPWNSARTGTYQTLNLTGYHLIGTSGSRNPTVVFVNLKDALDRRNPAGVTYAPDFSRKGLRPYIGRTLTLGLSLPL